jgi:hypothetical protein
LVVRAFDREATIDFQQWLSLGFGGFGIGLNRFFLLPVGGLRWKLLCEISLLSFPEQRRQVVNGGSENFWIASSISPQVMHWYS